METHVRTLAQAQAELGVSVRVVCVQHEALATAEERDGSVPVTRVARLASLRKFDVCPELPSILSRVEADLFHVQVPNPTMIVALLAARRRIPIVVTYQSDHIRQRILGPAFRPIERVFYRRVGRILPTSPPYVEGSDLLRALRDKVEVLPMGIDLSPYLEPGVAARAEIDRIRARHPGPLWLSCGRLIYYKGLRTAVRALARVPGTLLVIGDGPERPALEAEAAERGVSGRLAFLGAMPYQAIVPYYHAAHAFWFPSNARSEAFGLVQVEAMASGCPVINTEIPGSGVAWVSPDDESGLTVPMDDGDALARAARRLVDEPGLRERLAAGGRARARAHFDHRVMARSSLEIYERLLRR
jgi:rhamnosyl/mannosyltransferase